MKLPMRRSIMAGMLLAALASSPSAAGQDLQAEKAAVEQALQAFFDAAQKKHWAHVDALLTSDFQFYSDSAVVLDKAGFMAAMQEDDMDVQQLNFEGLSVGLSAQADVAWVKYRAVIRSTVKGSPANMASVETVVFRKEDNMWKMAHNHASLKGF